MKRGITLIELIIAVALIAIVAIIAADAIWNPMVAIKYYNENDAVEELEAIARAQSNFRAMDKDGDGADFATSLGELASYGLLDSILATGTKTGYVFTVTGATNTWTARANAEEQGKSGDRSFFIDESGVFRFRIGSGASASDTPIEKP